MEFENEGMGSGQRLPLQNPAQLGNEEKEWNNEEYFDMLGMTALKIYAPAD